MAGNSGEPGRTVTSKLAAILTTFTGGDRFTLSEMAMQTNLAISSVHRLLNDLVRASLLERAEGAKGATYRPGPTLRSLPFEAEQPTLRARAPFVVDDLAASLHTPARLGVLDGHEVAYVEKRPEPEPGSLFPNPARLPVHATAMGKVLLAFGPRSLARLVIGCGLPRYTPMTLTCPMELERALQTARARGFALVEGELHPAASTVAVPVFDAGGRTIAAIEVDLVGPTSAAVEIALPALLTAARCLPREIAPLDRSGRSVGPGQEPTEPDLPRKRA